MHPIIVSQVDSKVTEEVSSLAEIKDDKVYRVRVSVSHSSSSDPAKCIRVREKNELKPIKGAAKKGQELVTCMQFLVKDASQLAKNHFTRLFVVDKGEFFGVNPVDI